MMCLGFQRCKYTNRFSSWSLISKPLGWEEVNHSRHGHGANKASRHMGVSKNRGIPKWMVYNGKLLLKWMIWGYPYFWNLPVAIYSMNGQELDFFNLMRMVMVKPEKVSQNKDTYTP